jgi:hypothetical protein
MANPLPKERFLAFVRELLSDKGLAATRREGEAIAESLAGRDGAVVALVYRLLQILHPPKRKGSDRTAPARDVIKQRVIDRYYGPILEILADEGWDENDLKTRKLVAEKLCERGIEIKRRDVNSTLTTLAAFGPVLRAKYAILYREGDSPEIRAQLKTLIHERYPKIPLRNIAQVLANEVTEDKPMDWLAKLWADEFYKGIPYEWPSRTPDSTQKKSRRTP